jgi:hypothetical protein
MSPKTKVDQKCQEDAEAFKNSFTTLFSVEKLKKIYSTEKNVYDAKNDDPDTNFDKVVEKMLKKMDLEDRKVRKFIPKSLEYMEENIMHANSGEYYVLCFSKTAGYYPKEYSKETFKSVFSNYFPSIVRKWIETVQSKNYEIVVEQNKPRVYAENETNYLNMFNGYPDDNVERNEDIIKEQSKNISKMMDHIKNILCGGNEQMFNEIKNWIYALIGGRRKLTTAVYLNGPMGIGKGLVGDLVMKILGSQNCFRVQHASQLMGSFNGHLAGKLFVYIDDLPLTHPEFCSLYNVLKVVITEQTNTYRDLFKRAITLNNLNSVWMNGNGDMVKLDGINSGKDRRLLMADTKKEVMPESYFKLLRGFVDNPEFRQAFLWHCQDSYDPDWNEQVNIKKLQMSNTANNMILRSLPPIVEYLKSILEQEDFEGQRKPKDEYNNFCEWYKVNPTLDAKRVPKFHQFMMDLQRFNKSITSKTERYHGKENIPVPNNPTVYITIDKNTLVKEFKTKGYFSKFDTVDGESVDEIEEKSEYETLLEDMSRLESLKNEMKILRDSILDRMDCYKGNPITKTIVVNDDDSEKYKKRILPVSKPTKSALDTVDNDIFTMSFN